MTLPARRPQRILLLPGWLDSDAGHWQSRWEHQHGDRRVQQDDWVWPRRGDWMARLDEVILETDTPNVLVGHSLGCQLVASWAAHSRHTARVCAAMLVAPPDTERDDTPPNLYSWRPITTRRLPFPALVVSSQDDPYCSTERARDMALDWGCTHTEIGRCGHINTASGLADWPHGRQMLDALLERHL